MKKTRELIEAHLKLVDVVLEVCDARIPVSSRNPIIGGLTAGKQRVLILNKSDLADKEATKAWLECFNAGGLRSLALNSMSGQGISAVYKKLEYAEAERASAGTARNRAKLPLRMMIVGIPNSGKSSLINRLVGKRATQVGDRPGVTRGKQWLTLENGMQLLDTPGILWPKFEDPQVGLNLAFCGSIRDEIMDITELALELLTVLLRNHAGLLAERYGVDTDGEDESFGQAQTSANESSGQAQTSQDDSFGASQTSLAVMERIANKRGYILPGKRVDYERTARALLDEFRAGKIGRITLELPEARTQRIKDGVPVAPGELYT